MNINQIFDSEKVRKMRNLGNVVSAGSPLCYEQNQCAGEWTAPLLKPWSNGRNNRPPLLGVNVTFV